MSDHRQSEGPRAIESVPAAVLVEQAFDLGMKFQSSIGDSCYDGRDVQRCLTAYEFREVGVRPEVIDPQMTFTQAVMAARSEILRAFKAYSHV